MSTNLEKRIGVLAVVVLVSTVFWYYAKPWVDSPNRFADVNVWIIPLVLLIVLAPIIVLALMFFRKKIWSLAVEAAVAIPFVAIFGTNVLYLTAFLIIFLLFSYADRNISIELNERIKVNAGMIMNQGLHAVVTGILIVVSFAYFLSPAVQASDTNRKLPPTVQEVVTATVNAFLGEQLDQLPPQQREQTKNQVIRETMNQLTQLAQPYFKYLPPILAFGLFLILRGLSFIFIFLSIWLGQLMFWFLRKVGFVKVEERDVKIEVLVEL